MGVKGSIRGWWMSCTRVYVTRYVGCGSVVGRTDRVMFCVSCRVSLERWRRFFVLTTSFFVLFYAVCREFWITQMRRMFWAARTVRVVVVSSERTNERTNER